MLGLVKESASKYCLCIDAHPSIDVHRPYQTFSYGRITGPSTKDKYAHAKMLKEKEKKKKRSKVDEFIVEKEEEKNNDKD